MALVDGTGAAPIAPVPPGLRLHAALDLLFAALYAWLGFVVAPGRSATWNLALATVIALLAGAGIALLCRTRWARPLALAAHGALLGLCMVVVALLVASAAYLRGIYGPLGQGLSLVTLIVGALVVELCGLLPIFQLRLLLRDDVRLHLSPPRHGPGHGRAAD